jgi:hypothetical protein
MVQDFTVMRWMKPLGKLNCCGPKLANGQVLAATFLQNTDGVYSAFADVAEGYIAAAMHGAFTDAFAASAAIPGP